MSDLLDALGYQHQGLAGWAYTLCGEMRPYAGGGDPDRMKAVDGVGPGCVSVWSGAGDGDGVVIVPADAVEKVLNEAGRLTATEVQIRAELDAGFTLEQVLARVRARLGAAIFAGRHRKLTELLCGPRVISNPPITSGPHVPASSISAGREEGKKWLLSPA